MRVKECPFCGGEAKIIVNAQTLSARACCEPCKVIMKRDFKGSKKIKEILEEMITQEWNRRDGSDVDESSRKKCETESTL